MKRLWNDLMSDNPMPRLNLAFSLATMFGGFGVLGVLLGLIGVGLKLLSPDWEVTWGKIGDMIAVSLCRAVVGYVVAAVIHAVAQVCQKSLKEQTVKPTTNP